jgi:6-phosphogluconolactonase
LIEVTAGANSQVTRWHSLRDPDVLATEVARAVLALADEAISRHGVFRIVLAGGKTPAMAYRQLVSASTSWPAWQVYFGDERCLPRDHPERNDVMAARHWLDRVDIPQENVHRIPAELGAEIAASEYAQTVRPALPFDLVLLGMGEDGHTASLFPGDDLTVPGLALAVHDAPKPPPERVSLSLVALNHCSNMIVMVSGRNKQGAVQRWRQGDPLPVAAVHADQGVDVYLDAAATPA